MNEKKSTADHLLTGPLRPETIIKVENGCFQHIDQNRELLELIQQKYPSLFEENKWVESWTQSQEGFLNGLSKSVPSDTNLRCNVIEGKFPVLGLTNNRE
jgi:hypothetical protein